MSHPPQTILESVLGELGYQHSNLTDETPSKDKNNELKIH